MLMLYKKVDSVLCLVLTTVCEKIYVEHYKVVAVYSCSGLVSKYVLIIILVTKMLHSAG